MEQPFNPDALAQRIGQLSLHARLAFLLSCAERLIPNYAAFSRHHGWGHPGTLRDALDLGWRQLSGNAVERGEIEACLGYCEDMTPDTEDFQSAYVSAGLDAAVCCASILELLLKDDSAKVVDGASLACGTVDMHVQELERYDSQEPELEQKIFRHPLMQRELRRQREDLDLLETMSLSSSDIEVLARKWRNPAASNIDRH
ncbi:YjaG family protein [Myxococcus stipitatus]|uniref:DUF416 family protein n=1 Tax=Myxococcus stipitatus TaxID=83455 RepID=UPI003145539F